MTRHRFLATALLAFALLPLSACGVFKKITSPDNIKRGCDLVFEANAVIDSTIFVVLERLVDVSAGAALPAWAPAYLAAKAVFKSGVERATAWCGGTPPTEADLDAAIKEASAAGAELIALYQALQKTGEVPTGRDPAAGPDLDALRERLEARAVER